MNDFLNKVEHIKNKFTIAGYHELSSKLSSLQISGGTPGEVFAGVAYNLSKMKEEHHQAYHLVKEEIEELLQYAKSINYL